MADQNTNEPLLRFKKVAIIATEGFEESELFDPKKALEEAGAQVTVISIQKSPIRSWSGEHWGREVAVDRLVTEASPRDFDALMLPGGVANADRLRNDSATVSWVTDFVKSGKPVAAICHAPWILIETGDVRDRVMTSWPSLKTDLQNAGAEWVDQEVVIDGGWVTSRKPDDIPAFNRKMIEEFREGKNQGPTKRKRPKATDSLSLRH